jgi:K+-transporting ATPase ATPase C chain
MNMQTSTPTNQIVRPAIVAVVLFTIITGVLYPALVTGIAQAIFPAEANGSLIRNSAGVVIGSELIGQEFSDPIYFWGRPSATAPVPYNAAASSGSNLGPLNPALIGEDGLIQTRITALRTADADAGVQSDSPLPVDLVTASASGLDPHISPASASVQSVRIAALRGIDVAAVEGLIDELTEDRMFGLLGEPRVNVLRLNLALDQRYPPQAASQP